MFKQMFMMKRRPGLTLDAFKHHYENVHAKFGEQFLQLARRYMRRYVTPQKNPLTHEAIELPFDVIMEIWWDSREDSKADLKRAHELNLFPAIAEDEKKVFSTSDNPVFTVEEYDSVLPRAVARNSTGDDPKFKLVFLLKRRPGMTLDEFKDYYENHHSKFGEQLMPGARRYVRRYVRPQKNPLTGNPVELGFDVVMENWWDSKADYEACMEKAAAGGYHKLIYEDEEKLFNTHDNPVFLVTESDSVLKRSPPPVA
jgi:hypothetical protein